MEMMESVAPEVQDDKGWLTKEEKIQMINELNAYTAQGGSFVEFAKGKNVSESTLYRYRKESGVKEKTNPAVEEALEKVVKINELVASGMTKGKACSTVGMSYARYHYYQHLRGKKAPAHKDAPRIVKAMVGIAVTDDRYNKSLRARIISLEKLIVELSLDKQALMEAREGAI